MTQYFLSFVSPLETWFSCRLFFDYSLSVQTWIVNFSTFYFSQMRKRNKQRSEKLVLLRCILRSSFPEEQRHCGKVGKEHATNGEDGRFCTAAVIWHWTKWEALVLMNVKEKKWTKPPGASLWIIWFTMFMPQRLYKIPQSLLESNRERVNSDHERKMWFCGPGRLLWGPDIC